MTRLLTPVFVLALAAPAMAGDATPFQPSRFTSTLFEPAGLETPAPSRGGQSTRTTSTDRPHSMGVGGRAGGFTFGVGASLRGWQSERVGFQVDLSHYGVARLGILQVAPSVLVVLGQPDLDRDTQIRPYAGGGINVMRVSYTDLLSETSIGGQGFVGAELVFRGAPRFALSGDLGYYSTGDFFGTSVGGFALSIAGHYYIR